MEAEADGGKLSRADQDRLDPTLLLEYKREYSARWLTGKDGSGPGLSSEKPPQLGRRISTATYSRARSQSCMVRITQLPSADPVLVRGVGFEPTNPSAMGETLRMNFDASMDSIIIPQVVYNPAAEALT